MIHQTYQCNLCERQLEVLNRGRYNCHTLCRAGPPGWESSEFTDEQEHAGRSEIHICQLCWEGLEKLFKGETK